MAFHEAWKREAAEATLCGVAPILVLPGLREALSAGQCLLLIVGGACVHSDPTGLHETTCQQSFCLMVLALGNWALV